MIRLRLETELTVREPDENEGLVVRWRVVVVRDHDDTVQEDVIGTVRASVIHYGEALNVGARLRDVMDGALLPLYDAVFTKEGWLHDDLADASGSGLLFIEQIDLADEWRERLVDLAVVGRLTETLGQGCSLAVLDGAEARRLGVWETIGFAIVRGASEPFLALDLSTRHPHLRAGFDRYEVIPTPQRDLGDERVDEHREERHN